MTITLHTVYVVSLVSQATSTVILALLAWSDRRTRGLVALATACGLHAAAVFFMPMWRSGGRLWPAVLSGAMLPLIFFLFDHGLRDLLQRRQFVSRPGSVAVAAVMALVAVLVPVSRLWAMQIAFAAAILLIGRTVWMLWTTETAAARLPARATSGFLLLILLTFVIRLPLEPHVATSHLLVPLRELTMAAITLLAFSFLAIYLAETQRRLYIETRLDALTGLLNRRAMEEQAALHIRHAQRSGAPLALLMLDLDFFKLLNDTWGHSLGDRALRAVGEALLSFAVKNKRTVARLGGEEFAVLLPDHALAAAQAIAEQLRLAVASLSLFEDSRRVSLTVSIGVASWHAGETSWTAMLRRADKAVYQAKHEGRNRVALCPAAATTPALPKEGSDPKQRAARPLFRLHIDDQRIHDQRIHDQRIHAEHIDGTHPTRTLPALHKVATREDR